MAKEKWGRRLGVRGRGFGALLGQKPLQVVPLPIIPQSVEAKVDSAAEQEVIRKKEGFEPLVVWRRDQLTDEDKSKYPDRKWAEAIEVPPCIARFLRPHQREGVQFMAECVLGLRRFKGNGAILADDMGWERRCRASHCCTRSSHRVSSRAYPSRAACVSSHRHRWWATGRMRSRSGWRTE